MYVIIQVTIPKHLTREQKKLFEQLNKTDLEDERYSKIEEYL